MPDVVLVLNEDLCKHNQVFVQHCSIGTSCAPDTVLGHDAKLVHVAQDASSQFRSFSNAGFDSEDILS